MTFDVQKAVQTFAQEMQDRLNAVIPRPDDFRPRIATYRFLHRGPLRGPGRG